MGWTSKRYTDATHHSFDENNAAEFIKDEIMNDTDVITAHFKRSEYFNDYRELYLACRQISTGNIYIMVILIEISNSEIFWKEITESMGPSSCNCPVDLFESVPIPNKYAEEWRKDCVKKKIKFNPLNLN